MDPAYFEEETGLGFYLTPADAVSTLHDLSEANVNTERAFWAGHQTTSYNVSLPVAVPLLGNSITIPNLMQYVAWSLPLNGTEPIFRIDDARIQISPLLKGRGCVICLSIVF